MKLQAGKQERKQAGTQVGGAQAFPLSLCDCDADKR
jgi:hypothetical protein